MSEQAVIQEIFPPDRPAGKGKPPDGNEHIYCARTGASVNDTTCLIRQLSGANPYCIAPDCPYALSQNFYENWSSEIITFMGMTNEQF